MTNTNKSPYEELMSYKTYGERFEYLRSKLINKNAVIGMDTMGPVGRRLTQDLYSTERWKRTRAEVIIRDNGCELGIPELSLGEGRTRVVAHVHHIVPVQISDLDDPDVFFNKENLITMSESAHKALHYGRVIEQTVNERTPGDTKLW